MSNFYNNNLNLKSVGVPVEYAEQQLNEYIKCKNDPIYFIRNYCKIISLDLGLIDFQLFDYQERFLTTIHKENRVVSMQPRQSGKTQVVAAYILYYTLFNENKTVAILANKAVAAREILSRYQLMYEYLPSFLQQGVKTWNKGDIELENGSKVFTSATSSSGIRGKSCVSGDTKICIEHNDGVYFSEIQNFINNSNFINVENTLMKYSIYKTTNKITNKIYIGFHTTDDKNILSEKTESGGIFNDGYLGSGKLIKRAIAKYGPENFYQELIGLYDTEEEAKSVEKSMVDLDFVSREDTYNLSIGGNVTILYGENNGFYGKTHTKKSLDQIQETRNKNQLPTYQFKIKNLETNEIYLGFSDLESKLTFNVNREDPNFKNKLSMEIYKLCYEGKLQVMNEDRNLEGIEKYKRYLIWLGDMPDRKEEKAKITSDRFLGSSQTQEHIDKRMASTKEWREQNPELHKEKMDRINKDPEKIRKTAEKHTGMKRSSETCKNISESLLGKPSKSKGKLAAKDPITNKISYFSSKDEIPKAWSTDFKRGPSGRKSFTDGILYKLYTPGTEPEGWILGGAPNKR